MKNGFTLVELSIVLVIIGLLIGGILVGQSLIESAKINQAVRQIQQYDIAVSNFQGKFNQLPGDSDKMTPAGNNDGTLSDSYIVAGGVPVCGIATCRERMIFWKHLSDSGMLKGSYDSDFTNDLAKNNTPTILEDDIFAHVLYVSSDGIAQHPQGWFYYFSNEDTMFVIDGITFSAIESKIDDGNGATGAVRSENLSLGTCTSTDATCALSITLMSTNGQPLNN